MGREEDEKICQFKDWLTSRRYSANTVKTYTEAISTMFKFFTDKDPSEITNSDLIRFNKF